MPSMRSDGGRGWRKLASLPAFFIITLAILLLVGISAVRETYRGWTVENEISALDAQAAQLEGRKLKLAEVMDTLSSPERVDFEARARLGWKKDGERVYVVPGIGDASSSFDAQPVVPVDVPPPPDVSNPQRWLRYFLHEDDANANVPSI